MFSSEFKEARESDFLHIIKVDCLPEVLEIVLTFLYTEKSDCPLELALDVLYTADMLLLEKLKAKAALAISTLGSDSSNALVDRTHKEADEKEKLEEVEVESINVYDVIRAAWDLKVQRLEDFAARYLANRLEDYIDEQDFWDLIQESASRIRAREETDTIELLDDIRYYLSERFRLRFEDTRLEELLDDAMEQPNGTTEGDMASEIMTEKTLDTSAIIAASQDLDESQGGLMRTLDGELVEDEFDSDAINYRILLEKIDAMLDRLKLDA
jgi:hypothetical protein